MIEETTDGFNIPGSSAENFHHQQCYKVEGKSLIFKQFIALLIKRFHHFRKSRKGFLCEIVMPALFILLAMFFSETNPPFTDPPPLELHPWHYTPDRGDRHLYTFYSNYPCESDKVSHTPWTKVKQANDKEDKPECSCATGVQHCSVGFHEPPKTYLASEDYLYNLTGEDVSDWLVKTTNRYIKRRDLIINIFHNSKRLWQVWFNNKGWIAGISYMNVMNNLLLRSYLPFGRDPRKFGITTIHHPMNLTKQQLSEQTIFHKLLYNAETDSVVAICVIFAMCFIPASFVMILIEERVSNSKHLQFVSGVNPAVYWVSTFVWDMINYAIPAVLCIIIFMIFNKEAYVGVRNFPCLVALMFLYGLYGFIAKLTVEMNFGVSDLYDLHAALYLIDRWAMIPLMYPFSRVFNVPSTAMVTLKSISIFLGTTSTLATFILDCLEDEDKELKRVNHILRQVLLILPQYCLGRGLLDMSRNQMHADTFKRFGVDHFISPFEWSQVGRNLLSLFVLGCTFFTLNLLIEYGVFTRKREKFILSGLMYEEEDFDVTRERSRILGKRATGDIIRVENLTKVYSVSGQKDKFTAVDRLSFGVPHGQCFGLLGVNGAGKSTTFQILTGEIPMTAGNAYINGYSIVKDINHVRRDIGYCPQFDAFDPLMTAEEVLSLYARLRGIPESDVQSEYKTSSLLLIFPACCDLILNYMIETPRSSLKVVDWGIKKLGLTQYAKRRSGNYSGGNKRKLSTAISLIGNPSVIFLDEPTSGMDPRSRRFLWNCINNIVKDGRSVILTSHSMEECEALCGRLAIMVNGRFSCIGSTQHLKNRFGDGYTVKIRVSGEHPDLHPIEEFINNTFNDTVLKERHHNLLHYQLASDFKLSYIFGQIEAVRKSFNIEDYCVSQTTLDQVFINFAKKQSDLPDDEYSTVAQTLAVKKVLSDMPDLERGNRPSDDNNRSRVDVFSRSAAKSALKVL
ncbi:hypothetical protein KUTeg_016886 [Tegillarca granosa]|uniref:ABC transporter domain-containing protein n=1 Tax=Tegillarca granosa TaxID=220873 RepID=A0ABQ9ER24_TEGGR|nr:hypothetical protein KUTeg_016886 [Tegillarca granosa]